MRVIQNRKDSIYTVEYKTRSIDVLNEFENPTLIVINYTRKIKYKNHTHTKFEDGSLQFGHKKCVG